MSCIKPQEFKAFEDVSIEYLVDTEGVSKERAETIAYNHWKQVFFENSTKTEAKVFSQIANQDGSIYVRHNGNYNPKKMKLVGVQDDGKYYTVSVQDLSSKNVLDYTFLRGQRRSIDLKGKKNQFVLIDSMGYALGSSDDVNINPDLYDKQELDLVNNTENSLKLLDKLADIDGDDISVEHKSRLSNVLQMFVDTNKQMIPQMNVYLNEQAEKAGGVLSINNEKIEDGIYVGINPSGKESTTDISNSEVYAEEIVHAGTVFALKVGGVDAQNAKTRIQQLRDQVREEFRKEYNGEPWKAFMPEESIDLAYDEKQAKKMWDYIFNNKETGIEEFIAKGLTWEVFANKLDKIIVQKPLEGEPKTLLESIVHWLKSIFQIAKNKIEKEGFNTTATDVLVRMSSQLAEANNKGMKQTDTTKFLGEVFGNVNDLDKKMSDWVKKHISKRQSRKNLPVAPRDGAGKLEWAVYAAKLMPFLLGNTEGQIAIKELMNTVGFKYGNDIQNLFEETTDPDNLNRVVQTLRRWSENIDNSRETRAKLTAKGVADAFKMFSKKEKEALTLAGLDVDIQSIYDDYDVAELLVDSEKLKEVASELRKKVREVAKDKETGNYYVAQATGLGYYLANHQTNNNVQLLNATLIAKGHNRTEKFKLTEVSEETVKYIDQLATVEGLLRTPAEAKVSLSELIKREPNGMNYVVQMSRGINEEAKMKTFSDDELGMIKGYTKEIFDEDISVVIRPLKDGRQLVKEGYKLVKVLEKAPGDTSLNKMGMFVNKWHAQQNLKKGAIRLTDVHTKGTTLYDAHKADQEFTAADRSKLDVVKIETAGIKEIRAMEKGTFDFTEDNGRNLVPVYGRNGRVTNYRYMMDKRSKREYLKQDISAPAVLGRTVASTQDKVNTAEHNNKVFDIIIEDMKENYDDRTGMGKDPKKRNRYYKLEKDSPDPMIEEVWKILPNQFKQKMREGNFEYLAVRADLFKAYFGMREYGLMDVIGSTPFVGEAIVELTPETIKYALQVVEHIWQNIVNLAKVNIIIKIPEVLIRNIISNVMIGPLYGHYNLAKVAKLQLRGAKGLFDYIAKTKELVLLENAKLAGNPNNLDVDKIESLREDLKKHQVADLINEGMYQAIVEEITQDEFKSSNRIARFFDDQLDKAPGFVHDGVHTLFLTEKTKYFKFIATATQFSDFASRYAIYELEKEKYTNKLNEKFKGKSRIKVGEIPYFEEVDNADEIVTQAKANDMLLSKLKEVVLDVHIDYGKLDGPVLDYLNRIGFAMFTKYANRILRPLIKSGIDHPLHMFSTIMVQNFVGDVDDITDSFGKQLNKFGNVSPFTGLIDDVPLFQVYKNVF